MSPGPSAPAPILRPGAHAHHDSQHGGIVVMDGNLYHHLEGTYPETGLFRLHVYDDFMKPIDAKGTTGSIRITGGDAQQQIPLEYEASTQALVARIAPAPSLPLRLEAEVNLLNPLTNASNTSTYRFEFKAAGGEAAPSHGGASHDHAAGDHAHSSPHGGQVVTAGANHHLELVITPGMITLWLLDAQENTLPVDGMEATLLLQPQGGAPISLPLPPMGSVHFMANSPLASEAKGVAVATVKMPDGTKTARFTFGGAP
jgi:hypothetical protein